MSHYFAYGSNMDQDQMRERCPDAKLLGVASLPDYRLAFTIYSPTRKCGCADILPSVGETVYGLLYEMTDSAMKAMDEFEGHPVHYRRIEILVEKDGMPVRAYSYEVVRKITGLMPSDDYLLLITNAARKFNFPRWYQKHLGEGM